MYIYIHKSINITKPSNSGYVKAVAIRHHQVTHKNEIGHKM